MCGCHRTRPPTRSSGGSSPARRRTPTDTVALRYLGAVSLLVKGAVSGRVYALRSGEARLDCDLADVAAFLASPLFVRLE